MQRCRLSAFQRQGFFFFFFPTVQRACLSQAPQLKESLFSNSVKGGGIGQQDHREEPWKFLYLTHCSKLLVSSWNHRHTYIFLESATFWYLYCHSGKKQNAVAGSSVCILGGLSFSNFSMPYSVCVSHILPTPRSDENFQHRSSDQNIFRGSYLPMDKAGSWWCLVLYLY